MQRIARVIRRSVCTLAAASLALMCVVSLAHATDDSHVVRIGYQKGTPYTLLKAQGSLEKRLAPLGYRVNWIEFPAGPQLIEAMDVGSIDLGYTGAPPPIFAQAAQKRVLYLAAEPAGKQNEAILVKPDSTIHSVADLKGHTIAFQRGSSSHYLLLASLERAGLHMSDIHAVSLTPADARAAFEAGKVDAWVIWDTYLAVAQRSMPSRVVGDWGQGLVQPHGFFLGAPAFADDHADLVKVVFEEVAKSDAWAATHPDDAARLFASQIGVDRATVDLFLSRSRFGIVPVDEQITSVQQTIADAFYAEKVLPAKVHVADIVWKGSAQAAAR